VQAPDDFSRLQIGASRVASDGTVLTTKVDYRPTVYSLGVAYKF